MADDTGAIFDPMGSVSVPPVDGSGTGQSGVIDAAFERLAKAGAFVGRPLKELAQRYTEDTQNAARESADLAVNSAKASGQALRENRPADALGNAVWQTLGNLGVAASPLTGAAKTIGHYATQATGNPAFGERVELIGGFADPSHVGAIKGAIPMLSKASKVAEEVAPYAAIFVGPGAKGADLKALEEAKRLTAEGVPADEIWRQHMWRQTPAGGDWITELSDEGLKLHPVGVGSERAYQHNELHKAYPEIAGNASEVYVDPSFSRAGAFSPETKAIETYAATDEDARRVLAHELQHNVQDIEKMSGGANPDDAQLIRRQEQIFKAAQDVARKHDAPLNRYVDKMIEKDYAANPEAYKDQAHLRKMEEQFTNEYLANIDPTEADAWLGADYVLKNIRSPYDLYQHEEGEAFARAAAKRVDMSMDERRANPPTFETNTGKPIPEENLVDQRDIYGKRTSEWNASKDDIDQFMAEHHGKKKSSGGSVDEILKTSDDLINKALRVMKSGS